jgi:hypothetical protein
MTTETKKDPEYGIILTPCPTQEELFMAVEELVRQGKDFCVSGTHNNWIISYSGGPAYRN